MLQAGLFCSALLECIKCVAPPPFGLSIHPMVDLWVVSFFKNDFIVVQIQLSAFTPHKSSHPSHPYLPPWIPAPVPVLSMCPL